MGMKTQRWGFGFPTTNQTLTAGATSSASSAFGNYTTAVRVAVGDEAIYAEFADSPTASSADMMIPAGVVEYFAVRPGSKIAVIRAGSNDVTVTVTEMTA